MAARDKINSIDEAPIPWTLSAQLEELGVGADEEVHVSDSSV